MHVVVIGAGHIGMYVIKSLSEKGERITVIDRSEHKCKHVSTTLDAVAFVGSGDDPTVLKSAELDKADVCFIATDNDSVNVSACRIAKKDFAVPYVVALANSPKRKEQLKDADADVVICPVEEAVRLFENVFKTSHVFTLSTSTEDDYKFVRLTIPINASVAGKMVEDLGLLPRCKVGLICRNHGLVFPDEGTQIVVQDQVFLFGAIEAVNDGAKRLTTVETT